MVTTEIISYIKTERARGVSDSTIKSTLSASGWSEKDISDAMVTLVAPMAGVKEYERKVKWIIFAVWIALYVLMIMPLIFSILSSPPFLLVATVWAFLATYIASYVVAKGSEPNTKGIKEIMSFIMRIIGAGAFIFILTFPLLFVGCLFVLQGI